MAINRESSLTLTFLAGKYSFPRRLAAVLGRLGAVFLASLVMFHLLLVAFTLVSACVLAVWNPAVTSLALTRAAVNSYEPVPYVFVPLAKIKPQVRRMFIILEDAAFYSHNGINPAAMMNALSRNRNIGKPLFGGSTITQQLARTLFLNLDKSYVRKYVEAIMALVLDAVLSKDRILELYLNNIEWGKGVYGIGSASRYYYGRSLAVLNVEETIRLAVIITNPIRYNINNYGNNLGMAYRYSVLVSALVPRDDSGIGKSDRMLDDTKQSLIPGDRVEPDGLRTESSGSPELQR